MRNRNQQKYRYGNMHKIIAITIIISFLHTHSYSYAFIRSFLFFSFLCVRVFPYVKGKKENLGQSYWYSFGGCCSQTVLWCYFRASFERMRYVCVCVRAERKGWVAVEWLHLSGERRGWWAHGSWIHLLVRQRWRKRGALSLSLSVASAVDGNGDLNWHRVLDFDASSF